MAHPNADDILSQVRRERDELRETLTREQGARAVADRALQDARSRFGDDDDRTNELVDRLQRADASLKRVTGHHDTAIARVHAELRERLIRDVGDDFTPLATSLPLVLFPVRLETRFALRGNARELWIRVYPDEIHADAHERELTTQEITAGQRYWNSIWRGTSALADSWSVLLHAVPAPRAAWVVRALTPLNVEGDRVDDPQFRAPAEREGTWTRAVEARLLPDRWVAIGYRGGHEVARAVGSAIIEPLAVTLAPDADAAQRSDISGDGLEVDDAVRWTIDFPRALEIGMGLTMPLALVDEERGFDELLVLGVKGSLSPADSATELGGLFEAHHFGRGLALLRQGTPTNNTQQAPSGYPPDDAHGEHSRSLELDQARSVVGKDGERLARALGLPQSVLTAVDRSDEDEQAGARAMCGALWPATWGYFFEELLLEAELDVEVDRFRDFFIEHVRARGHYPAFRVGGTPYGVVVASSLARWTQRGKRGLLESVMPDDLRRLRAIWSESVSRIPRVGKSNDPDKDLLEVLEMDASAREVRVRSVMGPNASANMAAFLGLNWDGARRRQADLARRLAERLGRADAGAPLFTLSFGSKAASFASGFVVPKENPDEPEPLSEAEPLSFNYIKWLREAASVEDVRQDRLPAGVTPPNTLLYLLLRHALLRESARSSDAILVNEGLATRAITRDREFVGATFTATPGAGGVAAVNNSAGNDTVNPAATVAATATVWDRMSTTLPTVTGRATLAEFVWLDLVRPETRRLREFREYLRTLESLPTAELERLLTETLDVCSHRLDPWITSMFNDRLTTMRASQQTPGSVVGSFGWVVDLRAKPSVGTRAAPMPLLAEGVRARLKLRDVAALEEQISTGGFTHAPSMTHAATAAVLRNGFLSRRSVNDQRYGIDLSSERVRRARWVLDAVRNGQALSAVLGYQFERALHDARRDDYKEPFRHAFPVVAGKLSSTAPATGGELAESVAAVAARNVVDGRALHLAWQANTIAWGSAGLPTRPGADFTQVDTILRAVDDTVDAIADLLMSESVYQLVQGNTAGASASLDALARGVRAPDPEVVKSPRGGSALTYRVALLLGGAPLAPAGWGAIPLTPRAAADPWMDGWLGALVGDPARVRCAVTYTDSAVPPVMRSIEVTLADLLLRPIDALHAVTAASSEAQPDVAQPTRTAQLSELDARIAAVALDRADADPLGDVRITYAATDRTNTLSFAEVAELMRAVQATLSTARTLAPKDLLASSQAAELSSAVVDSANVTTRATNALAAITAVRDTIVAAIAPLSVQPTPVNIDRASLVTALRNAAAFGVAGAFIPSPHADVAVSLDERETQRLTTDSLVAHATSIANELTRRLQDAGSVVVPHAKLSQLFGEGFRVIVPFTPATAAIGQALAAGPTPAPTPAQRREWLRGAALVRPPLDRYHRLTLLQRALGGPSAILTVTQVPHAPGAAWVALPFADEAHRPASGLVGLALLSAAGGVPAANASWAGLLLDEWTELIPNADEATAVAIHYDDPGAEAPQAILVAVPPDDSTNWTLDTVTDVLRETLQLARLRAVDSDLLGDLSVLLPATYLAANPKSDTVSAVFTGLLRSDAVIAPAL